MDIKKRANFIIAAMPQFEKTSEEDLRVLLPQRWKELHPEAIMATTLRLLAK